MPPSGNPKETLNETLMKPSTDTPKESLKPWKIIEDHQEKDKNNLDIVENHGKIGPN